MASPPPSSTPGLPRSLSSLVRPMAPSGMTSPLLSPSREQPSPWPAPSSPSVRTNATPPTPSISTVPPLAPYLPSKEALAAMAAAHKRAVAAAQRRSAAVADHKAEQMAKQLPSASDDPIGPSPQFVMQQQQLLAHIAMNVSAQPSPYLEAIMTRVADVESGFAADTDGTGTQQREQPTSQRKHESPIVRRPNALEPLQSSSPHATAANLSSLLSPTQSDQLQLYPQLLVQAVAPSLSPASALSRPSPSALGRSLSVRDGSSGSHADVWAAARSPSSDEWSSPSSSPAGRRPVAHRSKKSLLYGSLSRVRSPSPQRGWDDSFGALTVLAAPTQGRPRDRGTFGAPPKLLPNLLTQEKERINAERARVAKLNADRRERDRALERLERDRPPSPEKDWVDGKHSSRAVEIVRTQLDRLAPTSPSHHAVLLHEQMERDAARPGSAGSPFAHGSSPSRHQRHVTAGASFASHADDDRENAEDATAESESAGRLPCFTRAFLDSHGYSDQQEARRHLQHVSRLATSALRALHPADADQLPLDDSAAAQSSWDIAHAVAQALDPFLSYFDGSSRDKSALPAAAQHVHSTHDLDEHDSSRLRMYTASVSPGSVAPIDPVAAPLLSAEVSSDAALLLSSVLASKQWYLRGFDAAQQPSIPFDDELLEPNRAAAAASSLASPTSPTRIPAPVASRDFDARLHVPSLLPDVSRLGVSTAVFVAATPSHPSGTHVAIVEPGAALPPPLQQHTDTEHTAAAEGQGESREPASAVALAVDEPSSATHAQSELLERALLSLFPCRLDSGLRAEFAPLTAVPSTGSDDGNSASQRPICALLAQFRAEPQPTPPPQPPAQPQPQSQPQPEPTSSVAQVAITLPERGQAGQDAATDAPVLAPVSTSPVAASSPAPSASPPMPLKSALKSSSQAAPAVSTPAVPVPVPAASVSPPVSVSFSGASLPPPVDRKSSVKAPATIPATAAATPATAAAAAAAAAPPKADRKSSAPRFTLAPTVVATPSQRAALFSACRAGQHSAVALLVAGGVSVEEADEATGDRCIHMAIRNNDKKMFKMCIKAGANINAQNLRGETVLHVCASLKLMDLGKYAISKGADSKMKNDAGLTWKQ